MNISKSFHCFYEDMLANGYKAQKVLVFCRQRKDLRLIFQYFGNSLKHLYNNYKVRPYAMFHSETEKDIKNHVHEEFTDTTGLVRFLVATVAFGMGVDCKRLNLVIHYGAAGSIADYFQELERPGHDGTLANAVILCYPRCLSSKNTEKDMKDYVRNTEVCRRKLPLKEFGFISDVLNPLHNCYNIC